VRNEEKIRGGRETKMKGMNKYELENGLPVTVEGYDTGSKRI